MFYATASTAGRSLVPPTATTLLSQKISSKLCLVIYPSRIPRPLSISPFCPNSKLHGLINIIQASPRRSPRSLIPARRSPPISAGTVVLRCSVPVNRSQVLWLSRLVSWMIQNGRIRMCQRGNCSLGSV
jgi:hypothetical protein